MAKGDVIYSATRQRQSEDFEWRDQKGRIVAVEYRGSARRNDEEKLEILEPLGKKCLDMLVAVWVARIFQDSLKDLAREIEAEKRRKKMERRTSSDSQGKQGLFRDGEFTPGSSAMRD